MKFMQLTKAIAELKQGKMIILADDKSRENEGDMIFPAETIDSSAMNFMIRNGTGIVCLSLLPAQLARLNLPLMVAPAENTTQHQTPFTLPVDAKNGITTGVSAYDRVKTIQVVMKKNSAPEDLVRPGHIFPLKAKEGGVLERAGHTEGAIDIVKMAGFKPAAVLCEIMNPDGTMAKGRQLSVFAQKNKLVIINIQEIIAYRLFHENLIQDTVSATLPLKNKNFKIHIITEKYHSKNHVALFKKPIDPSKPLLVRLHSSCLTGDVFGSLQCDCQAQLQYALTQISKEGGALIYLDQEGRDIGLFNKIKAYHLQQNKGLDTVEANQHLGLEIDQRKYYMAAHILKSLILKKLKNKKIRLLTHNPYKITALKNYGISDIKKEAMPVFCNKHNKHYLQTKKNRLQHSLEMLPGDV